MEDGLSSMEDNRRNYINNLENDLDNNVFDSQRSHKYGKKIKNVL